MLYRNGRRLTLAGNVRPGGDVTTVALKKNKFFRSVVDTCNSPGALQREKIGGHGPDRQRRRLAPRRIVAVGDGRAARRALQRGEAGFQEKIWVRRCRDVVSGRLARGGGALRFFRAQGGYNLKRKGRDHLGFA